MAPKKKSSPASTGKKTRNPKIKIVKTRQVVARAVRKSRVAKPAKTKNSSKSISRIRADQAQKLKSLEDARRLAAKSIVETSQGSDEPDSNDTDGSYGSWDTDTEEQDLVSHADDKAPYRGNDARIAVRYGSLFPKELLDRSLTDKQWDYLEPYVIELLKHPRYSNMNPTDLHVWARYSYLGYLQKIQRTQKVSLDGIEWLARTSHEAGDVLNEIADQIRREDDARDRLTDPPDVQSKLKGYIKGE